MAFAEDGFDVGYLLKHDLKNILMQQIPSSMNTDNLSLFDVLTKATCITEKGLLIAYSL